jgi:hypothetical protein
MRAGESDRLLTWKGKKSPEFDQVFGRCSEKLPEFDQVFGRCSEKLPGFDRVSSQIAQRLRFDCETDLRRRVSINLFQLYSHHFPALRQ